MDSNVLWGLVVAPFMVRPIVALATCPTVLRWHRAFNWPQRIGILLMFVSGVAHAWMILR